MRPAAPGLFLCFLSSAAAAEGPPEVTGQTVRAAMKRAVDFLLADQNPDGSWGSPRNAAHEFWSNPETHRSWTVATTGLCCMALLEAEETEAVKSAYGRGIDYLLANAVVKRPSDWDVDNTWAYVYGLQALARACANPREPAGSRREEIRRVGQELIGKLAEYQTPSLGWGYYDFDGYTRPPAWATSFMTAAGVLALLDAKQAGFDVDSKMLERAVKAVKRCRLPSGAYTYSVEAIPWPRHSEWIDQIKGSLSRIQVCNLALHRAGELISREDLIVGLGHFFDKHRFLDIARKKPIPHEAYYLNSGYFYFFGHFYAAGVIERLPPDEQVKWWPKLRHHVLKTQEKDGSMWDWYLSSYHKPYGAAYGLMALARSVAAPAAGLPSAPAVGAPGREAAGGK